MPVRGLHDLAHLLDIVVGNVLMEQVAHRIYKYHSRLYPTERIKQSFGDDSKIKAQLVRVSRYAAKTLSECFSVAVFTAGADLSATSDRIPR